MYCIVIKFALVTSSFKNGWENQVLDVGCNIAKSQWWCDLESYGRLRRRMAVALCCASGLVSFAKGSQNVGVNLTMHMSKKFVLHGFDTS